MALTISATLVKELRERTGAGMMECKKALQECGASIDKAEVWLVKNGLRKVQKTANRVAAEGIIVSALSEDATSGVLIEVNTETDFVARDQQFNAFCQKLAVAALLVREERIEALKEQPLEANSAKTVEEARQELVARIGENIQIRRFKPVSVSHGRLGAYIHSNRIGVLVHMEETEEALAKDIAMHIAALAPVAIYPEDVPAEHVEREKELFLAKTPEEMKSSPELLEKMVKGYSQKLVNELSLMGQAYIKEPEITVAHLLKRTNSKVLSYTRYSVGEGIEKQQTDFAAEVMAQVRGST